MTIRIMQQAPSQMALLEAAQAALPHLQGPVREALEKALEGFDGAVVLTTWSEYDFDEGVWQVLSREARAKALYNLHKYYDGSHDAEVLRGHAYDLLAARPSSVQMQVRLVDGTVRYVKACDMAELLVTDGSYFHATEAAADLLKLDPSEIDAVDTDVHYTAEGKPLCETAAS